MSMNFATNVVVNEENTLQVKTIKAPSDTNSTVYTAGSNGQVLKSNGTSTYWGNESGAVTSVDGKTGEVIVNNGITFNLSNNNALLVTHESDTITAATDTTLGEISSTIEDLAESWEVAASTADEDDEDTILNITSGVRFIDYDGTLVDAYPTAKALTLSSLPDNPEHDGLTAQGWNWSLANIKAYLTKYPDAIVNVGQMYVTDDGKTRVYIHLGDERHAPMLGVCPNGTVDVDWGDGTTHDTLTGTSTSTVIWTPTHNYAQGGDYVIKLTVTGTMQLYGSSTTNAYSGILRYSSGADGRNRNYISAVNKIEIGEYVTSIGAYAFSNCYSLTALTIPDGVTSIGMYAFSSCHSLTTLMIPDGITSIGAYAFSGCHSLATLTIPDGVTSIGTYAFNYCYSITTLTIPDGVTSIGTYAFNVCESLTTLTIPDGVTSIGTNAFASCYSLTSLTIPDGVTSIGANAFASCYGIAEYHFLPTTPPALANANAFTGIPADCIIYVPYSADHSVINAYKTTSNWSTYADYMQEEPQS